MRKLSLLCGLILLCSQIWAQNRTITGKVTDERGNPVPNATVQVKGGNKGVSTDETGNFTISVGPKAVLVISSINFASQEVRNLSASPLVISLTPGKNDLAEVVVVAYGTQKKVDVTGSISMVKGNLIEDKPHTSVDKALQGAVAGLQVSSSNGLPGSATDIRIRGIGSIGANNTNAQNPLWVIDGNVNSLQGDLTTNTTSANALSTLNPDDIESISVLKDAAATAIYGSQAANGVIIVTTKSGKAGKTKVNLSTEIGANKIAFTNDRNRPVNTSQYQTLLRQSLINAGYAADNTEADALIVDPVNGLGLPADWNKTNTDWMKVVTRTGKQQQYNLSLSGGNDKTQYFASAGYFNQEGTVIESNFKRFNGNLSVINKVNDHITLRAGINGSSSKQLAPPGSSAYSSPISAVFFLPPYYSPYNADGTLKYHDAEGEFPEGGNYNPLVTAAWNKYRNQQTNFRGYITGEYQIIPNLRFRSNYSAEYLDIDEYSYWNPLYGDGNSYGGLGQAYDRKIFNWTWTNQLNYRFNITPDKDFYLDLLAATEAHKQTNNYLQAAGQAFPSTVELIYLANAGTPITAYNVPTAMTLNSYFGSATLNYKDRYVLSGSYRRDGSSIFAAGHKWGGFYSVGGSWNITEEDFLKNSALPISLLKLRASYGGTGNTSGFPFYQALQTYAYNQSYGGNAGSIPDNVGNPNLSWEKIYQTDIGLDFGFWKNRLTGTIDYYNKQSKDLLTLIQLSPTAGFSWNADNRGQLMNVGEMYNRGLELTLSGRPIATRDFTWDATFNISHNTNKVTKLYNHAPISFNTRFNISEGHNIYEFYTREWAGVDPANGDPLWYTDSTKKTTTNNSTNVPLQMTGKTAMPKYYGSFTNTFTYKGISLSAQLYYNFGNYIYSTWENYFSSEGQRLPGMGQLSNELRAWQKPGDHTDIPRIVFGGNKSSNRPSTRYLYKGDYIRLRDITLGYSLPKSLLDKAKISSISVYVRGTNLLTFATDKNLGIDPELGAQGIADLQVFMPKSITAGIKVGL